MDCEKVFLGHTAAINAIRFTSDGSYCMTASDDKSLRLWNPYRSAAVETNSLEKQAYCVQTFTGVHGYSVVDVAISQDKSRFASGGEDKSCFLWDVVQSRVIRRIQAHNLRTNSLCFNSDASVLFTASYDKTVKCWDLRAQQRDPIQILSDFSDSVTFVRMSSNAIIASSVDGAVRIYDMRQGYMHADNLIDPITSISLSEDEKTYIATCLGGKLRMMEISTGRVLKEYAGGHIHKNFKIEACYENDYTSLLCGSEDGSFCHYAIVSGEIKGEKTQAHRKAISSVAYHPTTNHFLTSSYDSEAKLWKKTTG